MNCWHRPGRAMKRDAAGVRSSWLCRFCGVAIEECPCEPTKRNEEPCRACGGSEWVAIWRGKVEKFAAYLADRL